MVPYLLPHLLTETADAHPDKTAVVSRQESCTYRELDDESNQLAHTLLGHGVHPGDRVGIYLQKSVASIVSIFGILKAGAVYVPLDPLAPPKRLAYIIGNCGIRHLVSSSDKAAATQEMALEPPLDTLILVGAGSPSLDARTAVVLWDVVRHESVAPPPLAGVQTDLAYLLYTSGSTGNPKGVMLSHLNALTFVNWAYDRFAVTSEDRLSNHAPLHFDLSVFDIFVSVKAGATVFLVPEGTSVFPTQLAQFIESHRISVWYSVPSALTLLVLHGNLENYSWPQLRMVLFAGEIFPVKYLRRLMELVPQAEYYNLYGPTETNVCTYYRVPPLSPDRVEPIPIGKACANTEVLALDGENRVIAKPGEIGELYVRGPSVTPGYWRHPEQTDRVLVRTMLQPHYEEKIYRTGDLVTLDPDGNYLYLGRKDDTIKSRGYRIALGEIEAILYSHSEVREAAVIALPDEVVSNRIKAVLVPAEGRLPTKMSVEKYCAERLPRYMIPEIIEFRTQLPKTSTGKVDKQRLLAEP